MMLSKLCLNLVDKHEDDLGIWSGCVYHCQKSFLDQLTNKKAKFMPDGIDNF